MSCALYLTCKDHDPEIKSDYEVGYRLSNLEDVRRMIANRDYFLKAAGSPYYYPDFGESHVNTASRFFSRHPKCNLGIRDETGKEHSL